MLKILSAVAADGTGAPGAILDDRLLVACGAGALRLTRVQLAGRAAMDELFSQTRGIYVNDPIKPEQLTKQIAFNVIPHIDVFLDDGSTKEEWKMAVETRKILDPDIAVSATCVRVFSRTR